GRGFVSHVSDGEKVEKGQLMLEVDVEMLVAEGYDIVTPVVVTNTQEYLDVLLLSTKQEVNYADDLLAVL
ncbi:PTS glucose transporter subunit IIA, partial [Streptococcus suis]